MQTFLPYADFELTAKCLDDERLGKQRLEAIQALGIIHELAWDSVDQKYRPATVTPWATTHPAVAMWKGYSGVLFLYARTICREWRARGRHDDILPRLSATYGWLTTSGEVPCPPWMGDPRLHASHRAVLLAKEPGHYGTLGWREPPAKRDSNGRWPYFWPTREGRS